MSPIELLYSLLLRLYPARFRLEFGPEMQEVFEESFRAHYKQSSQAGLLVFARELIHLPSSLLFAVSWNHRRNRSLAMSGQMETRIDSHLPEYLRRPSSLSDTLIGTGLFIYLALYFVLQSTLGSNQPASRSIILNILLLLAIAITASGYIVGWIKGCPRWWYPYAGFFFIYSLVLSNPTLEGSQLNRLFGKDMPGWIAWIPILVSTAAAILLTRTRKPLLGLAAGFHDLTFINFAFLGGYTWYLYAALLDIHGLMELPLLIISFLVVILAAWFFLRSRSVFGRAAAIGGAFLIGNTILVLSDWLTGTSSFASLGRSGVMAWLVMSIVFLLPTIILGLFTLIQAVISPTRS